MGSHTLPSPPAEDPKSALSRKNTSSSTSSKSAKQANRISKRAGSASSSAIVAHHHDHIHQGAGMDGRHKRVWKACERCRMKKTKCDGEFPCKRCKDDGLVCTAGVRKKVEYKQLPKGYAEVLENTQFALIATVHKLYSMVRNNQSWDLREPELNDRGQPVIHDIAQKLGCIRPNSDIDLPVHSVFPEDERGMHELALQLEEQQRLEGDMPVSAPGSAAIDQSSGFQRASSSDLDHSDFETDYRAMAFGNGRHNSNRNSAVTMSPQSFTTSNTDFELGPSPQDLEPGVMFPNNVNLSVNTSSTAMSAATSTSTSSASPAMPANFQAWGPPPTASMPAKSQHPDALTMQFMQQQAMAMNNIDLLGPELQERLMNQGLVESEFGTLKPHVLSGANSEVMLGMGDPMIFSGYEGEL